MGADEVKRQLTEDAALRIAQRVYSEDAGAPQIEIMLTPRALVRFFAIAGLDYEERKPDGSSAEPGKT